MKKIFVTGAGGFIGTYLVAQLLASGERVTTLMFPGETIPESWRDKVKIVIGDIRDITSKADEIGEHDIVFHLVAIVSGGGSKQDHVDVTVNGTKQVIELSLKWNARFVVTSSIAAFASSLGSGVLNEESPRGKPASNYEYVKQLQEDVTLQAVNEKQLSAVIIRPANVYGVGSDWTAPFVDLLAKKDPVLVGSGNWDAGLVHIHNLVQGMILAANNTAIPNGEIFVLSDDPGVTWQQYLQALSQTLELPAPKSIPNIVARILALLFDFFWPIFNKKQPPPMTRLAYRLTGLESIFDNSKAKRMLGYTPDTSLQMAMEEIKLTAKDIL